MTPQFVTELPFGFDEQTTMTLTPTNDIVIAHPVMPPMIYDKATMRWVEVSIDVKPGVIHTAKASG